MPSFPQKCKSAIGVIIHVGSTFIVIDSAGIAIGTFKLLREATAAFDRRAS
jgi:hypothetical protein